MADNTVTIERFLGLHMDSTDGLNIDVGELSVCKNVRITENYKLRKREGYLPLFGNASNKPIRGIWHGKIANNYNLVYATNGHVYRTNLNYPTFKNLVYNNNFDNGDTGWTAANATQSVTNSINTILASAQYGGIGQTLPIIDYNGRIIYFFAKIKTDSLNIRLDLDIVGVGNYSSIPATKIGEYHYISGYKAIGQSTASGIKTYITDYRSNSWSNIYVDYIGAIDLTATYGAGFEPTKAEMDAIFNSTNLGTNYYLANNLIINGNFESGISGWGNSNNISQSNTQKHSGTYSMKLNVTAQQQAFPYTSYSNANVNGHKLYYCMWGYLESSTNALFATVIESYDGTSGNTSTWATISTSGKWQFTSGTIDCNKNGFRLFAAQIANNGTGVCYFDDAFVIDLTATYGAGNEPTQSQMDAIFNPDLGTLTDARTYFFSYNDKLYIQNGSEYKYWDGTNNSIADVSGYIPKVAVATPAAGGGTPYEDINLLTGKKHQTFNGNNSATVFQLAETSINSVDAVYVGGVLKTVTTDYTVNTTNGTITFNSAPATGVDNVDIYWTKGTGTRATITNNKQSVLYGGANDSRVFMYGKDNKVVYSGLANGVPSAEYFPENNYLLIGSDEYNVTQLNKQYDRLIVHTERDSHYCVYEYDATNGASFPTYPLNDNIGNIAFGEGRNILNNPYVITSNGVFQFTATNVRDEKNAVFSSQRVQVGLDELDLSTAITFDWEKNYEYWLCVGKKAYIYNYKLDVWYMFELNDIPACFFEINGVAYFGTSNGKIMKFNDGTLTDNGALISSVWETGFLSFGANYIRKFLNFAWVGLQPEGKSKCSLSWQTDIGESASTYNIEYNLQDFGNLNFADFSFQTSRSPQPFRLKFKSKKFTYFKIIGRNDETTKNMVVLNITMPVNYGGNSK